MSLIVFSYNNTPESTVPPPPPPPPPSTYTNYIARKFSCSGPICGVDQGIDTSVAILTSTSVSLGSTYGYTADLSDPYVYRIDSVGGTAGLILVTAASCNAACIAIDTGGA